MHIKLGRGEEATGGRNKSSILSDTVEALIGAVYLSGGFEALRRGRAPAVRPADGERRRASAPAWTGRPACRSCRPSHSLGVPEYVIEDAGPDHEKTFTAQVRVGRQPLRARHRPVQEGGRAAGGRDRLHRHRRRRTATSTADLGRRQPMPELPEVEVVRRGLEAHVVGRTHRPGARCCTPARCAATSPAPSDFAAADRPAGVVLGAAPARQVPLAARSTAATRVLGHLGMSGQMLVQPAGAPDERHLRVRFALAPVDGDGRRWSCGSSTSGCSAASRSRPAAPTCPPEIAHIARDPLDPLFDDDAFVAAGAAPRLGHQADPARPDRGLRRRQHLRRRGAVARPAARRPARRPGSARADVRRVLADVRAVMAAALGEGGTSFDALYVNVNGESGYFDRSLHAYGQEGRPCDRCGTPIRAGRRS